MGEVIPFPDATAVVVRFLARQFAATDAPVPVGTRVPNPRPERFVLVRRVGGHRATLVTDAARLAVEAWDSSPANAADLAERCRSWLHAMAGTVQDDVPVYVVGDVGGPADLPDPLSDQPRYTFTVEVTVRGGTSGPDVIDGTVLVTEDGDLIVWP